MIVHPLRAIACFGSHATDITKAKCFHKETEELEKENPLSKMYQKALSDVNFGRQFGDSFELEIQRLLISTGYDDYFNLKLRNAQINGLKTSMSIKIIRDKVSELEIDGFVVGSVKNFESFTSVFQNSFIPFPPLQDNHTMIVEAKLNHKLLLDWINKNTNDNEPTGVANLFFDVSYSSFTKCICINGGEQSKQFISYLSNKGKHYCFYFSYKYIYLIFMYLKKTFLLNKRIQNSTK
jgi:hypothetical protein